MSRLIIESGAEAGMVYPFKNEAVTIGRSASSTIQIVDKRVSRHHAVLQLQRESFVIEDLGSKNGTFLNDDPLIGRIKLKSGDRILIGDTTMIFERDPNDPGHDERTDSTRSGVKLVPGAVSEKREEVKVDSSPFLDATKPVAREVLQDPLKRLRVLYQVADSIRSIVDPDQLLNRIMDILWTVVNPYRGVILLWDEKEGTLDPVVVRMREGVDEEITVSKGIVERCMGEQVAILVSDAPSDVRFSGNESVVTSGVRSVICAPLICKDEVLGVLYIDSQESGTVYFTNDELELITGISNQAAMAIVNARLHRQALERQRLEKELEIARTIQMNLLPKGYPEIEGVEFSALSMPARKVGGDYYDFIAMDGARTGIIIADVSGKGVPAAILTATIRASIRLETHKSGDTPVSEIVSAINQWTCRDATNNMFVTMFYCAYDPATRKLEYTNAGHCFPLIFNRNGEYRALEAGGCFLGIMEQVEYERDFAPIEPGDTLILYTDGVTDSHDQNHQVMGIDRMVETIKANLHLSAEELRDEIHEATLVFRGNVEQFDDLTIIVAKF